MRDPVFDCAIVHLRLPQRHGLALMNMHRVRLQILKVPMPGLDASSHSCKENLSSIEEARLQPKDDSVF